MAGRPDFEELVRRHAEASIKLRQTLLADGVFLDALEKVALEMHRVLTASGKLLLFGNGGSAADAQHIAAELVGRYKRERRGLAAIALTVNTSALTAIANDYGFEHVFARQLEALGSPGDIAIGISTSGDSPNVLRGVEAARIKGMLTIGLTGQSGGELKTKVDHCLCVPSGETPRIQEAHILLGHILCDFIEGEL